MNDDQLRDRIARLDPLGRSDTGGASIEPITSPTARSLMEDIMNTPLVTPVGSDEPTRQPDRGQRPWWAMAGAAAAVVAAVAVGVGVLNGNGDDGQEVAITTTAPTQAPITEPGKATVLDLSAGTDDLMASCMVLDATILGQAPLAFKGTVTMAEGGVVQLTVDQNYRGVEAQVVTLSAPEGQEALIGGVAWEVGGQYLVTAYDGVVSYCGQTGPVSPELQAIFDEAFANG